jgi:hypothetical protein
VWARKLLVKMKRIFILLSIIAVLLNQEISAQEKNSSIREQLLKDFSDSVALHPKYVHSLEVGTSFMSDLKGGYGIEKYVSPKVSFFPSGSMRFDFNATLGTVNLHKMSIYDYYNSTSQISGINSYFSVGGQATYRVNEKLYMSSVAFAEKMPFMYPTTSQNNINYGGAFKVGYKFTEKFSMEAGIEVQRFNDPWNVNPFMYNHGYIP